jgi:broad specificity phosphatase PhoE
VKLILVRHGETLWNKEHRVQGFTDIALSKTGKRQAERLAHCLQGERIDAMYCSTLQRAFETARAIGRFHALPIYVEADLRELNQGDFESLTFVELREKHLPFLKQWITQPGSLTMPNGESLGALQQRAWRVVDRIVADGRNALIVSHAFTIIAILCRIMGLSLDQFRQAQVDVASRTCIEFNDGVGEVVLHNDTAHLCDLSPEE